MNEQKPAPDAKYWNDVLNGSKDLSAKLDSTCSQSPQNRRTTLYPTWAEKHCNACGEEGEICRECGMCHECAMDAGDEGEGICRDCADIVILYMKTQIEKKTEDTLPFPTFNRFPVLFLTSMYTLKQAERQERE